MPRVGEPAPDFTLPSTHGPLTLSDLWEKGRVVLVFYTEDNTPACTQEVSAFKEEYETVREAGAEVVAVSVDTLESHRAFCEALGGCPFPLVADTDLVAGRLYGVVTEDGRRTRRAVFVIDRGGVLLHAIPHFNPANVGQFLEVFRALGVA